MTTRLWIAVLIASLASAARSAPQVAVEAEEEVYRYTDAANGAGPFWCHGCTCIVRAGQHVLVSGLETVAGAKPLNNTRWMLFRRQADGWKLEQKDPTGLTREPCPLGVFPDGSVLLSANPTLVPGQYSGPARPEILVFPADAPASAPQVQLPRWDGQPAFSEHSYRSFAVDGAGQSLILLQNIGYTHAEWSLRSPGGDWKSGRLSWPMGEDYAKPQPIRVCYPAVQLRGKSVYFCGVSDITEPNPAWREYKRKLTGREWDYDFRRLFFTWSDDITRSGFERWVEIASRERTAGHIFPCDLWAEADGTVHLLWYERALDDRLRKEFFPEEKQSEALNYAVVRRGEVIHRQAIVQGGEGISSLSPGRGRFHLTPDGRLYVLYYVGGADASGKAISENRLAEIGRDRSIGESVRIPLTRPLSVFFTATMRAGCLPSDMIDLLGDSGGAVRYARIRIE